MAEVVIGLRPEWYVLQIMPAHERVAAAHLAGRRFGIYAPELDLERMTERMTQRRRKRVAAPMFPGYVFVFAWLGPRNHDRIRSCPGVFDFLRRVDGLPAVIADAAVNAIRVVENQQRPLMLQQEGIGMPKRIKRSWRRSRRMTDVLVHDNEIMDVHTWSAFRDGVVNGDAAARNRLLHEALGIAA
jgi:transcription antitermination factor NusG